VVHPHGPYRARGRRRRSPRTPGTHTPVNQTMPDARRSDTPPRIRAEASETLPFISRLRRKGRLDVNSITRGPKTSYSQSSHRRAELGRLFGPDWRSFKAGTSLGLKEKQLATKCLRRAIGGSSRGDKTAIELFADPLRECPKSFVASVAHALAP